MPTAKAAARRLPVPMQRALRGAGSWCSARSEPAVRRPSSASRRTEAAADAEGSRAPSLEGRPTSRWWRRPWSDGDSVVGRQPGQPEGGARRAHAACHRPSRTRRTVDRFADDLSHIAHLEAQRYRGHRAPRAPRGFATLVPPAGRAPRPRRAHLPHGRRRGRRGSGVRPHRRRGRRVRRSLRSAVERLRRPRRALPSVLDWTDARPGRRAPRTWRRSGRRRATASPTSTPASTSWSSTRARDLAEARRVAVARRDHGVGGLLRGRGPRRSIAVGAVRSRRGPAGSWSGRREGTDHALARRAGRPGCRRRAPTCASAALDAAGLATDRATDHDRDRRRSRTCCPLPGAIEAAAALVAAATLDRRVAGKVLRADGRLESAGGTVFFDRSVGSDRRGISPTCGRRGTSTSDPSAGPPGSLAASVDALARRCRRRRSSRGRAFLREWCADAWAHGALGRLPARRGRGPRRRRRR